MSFSGLGSYKNNSFCLSFPAVAIFVICILSSNSTDNVACLSSPEHDFRERRQMRRDVEWQDNEEQADPLIGERWSSATMKVLSSMPSRTIGESCRRPVKILIRRHCNSIEGDLWEICGLLLCAAVYHLRVIQH